ncbi:unnamed protein product [Symbiodinium sp. CCMP2592]|nr:unnamed protein product [Symbiodinium sp. CCMP2592]
MKHLQSKGPLVKLMRWLSWFQSSRWYAGDLLATRMIFESESYAEDDVELNTITEDRDTKDAAEELRKLKKSMGQWKLFPKLCTKKNVLVSEILCMVSRATCDAHADNARENMNPKEVLNDRVARAQDNGWCLELVKMAKHSFGDSVALTKMFRSEEESTVQLQWIQSYFRSLCKQRAMSLFAEMQVPPLKWAGLLAASPERSRAALRAAKREWGIVMHAEAAWARGEDVPILDSVVWQRIPLVRLLGMAIERCGDNVSEEARGLMTLFLQTLGESRVVENTHQTAKDIFGGARHDKSSICKRQHAVLHSPALPSKGVACVPLPGKAEKAESGLWGAESKLGRTPEFVRKALPGSHKVSPEIQAMMKPKTSDHAWPSPTPASMFSNACAHHALQELWPNKMETYYLAEVIGQPGNLVFQKSSKRLCYVVAVTEFAWVSWEMKNAGLEDGASLWEMPLSGKQTRKLDPSAIRCETVVDLKMWAHIPSELVRSQRTGCLVFRTCGKAISLLEALCLQGTPLTVAALKRILQHMAGPGPKLGMSVKADSLRRILYKAVFGADSNRLAQAEQAYSKASLRQAELLEADLQDPLMEQVLEAFQEEHYNAKEVQDMQKIKKQRNSCKSDKLLEDVVPRKSKKMPVKRKKPLGEQFWLRARKRAKLEATETPARHDQEGLPGPSSHAAASASAGPQQDQPRADPSKGRSTAFARKCEQTPKALKTLLPGSGAISGVFYAKYDGDKQFFKVEYPIGNPAG